MPADQLSLGIFTTDANLVVRTWDAWMAAATGVEPTRALNHQLSDLIPDIETRGLLPHFERALGSGTVEVLAPALHHFLFPCAPAIPSPAFDRMQQHVTIGPLRDDRGIVGLIVTVEDVTARVERERDVAGYLKEHAHVESLTRLLGEHDWRVRQRAVTTLAQQGHLVVDALVRALRTQHDDLNVLSSALDLLALSDIDIVGPLNQLLDDDDANLRIQAALILGERRDRRAIPVLIAHLSDVDANVRFHVIEALGRVRAVEAADALVAIAEQRDFFLSFPAIQALTRVGSAAVAPRLVPLLADDMLRAPAIEALGAIGDEDVVEPLVGLLDTSSTPADVVADALSMLHERYESQYGAGDHIAALVRRTITPTGTQQILDAVRRVGPDRLPALAKMLGWLNGEAAQRALTRLLGQGLVRAQVVEALVRYGTGVVTLLTEQLHAEDLDTRQAAAVALGRIGDRRATRPLIAALNDREVVVAAAGALARIGDPDAFDALVALLGDRDPAIRQSAIAALNSIGHPDMPARTLVLLDDADPHIRVSALRIAGYFGYPQCLTRVLECCRDADEQVRRTAAETLPFFDDPRAAEPLPALLEDPVAAVRAVAVSTCARLNHVSRVTALIDRLRDPDAWVRFVTVKTLATLGDTNALAPIVATLESDSAPHVRLAAIDAVGRLQPAHALQILEPLTRSTNEDIARAAIAALGHVDQPAAMAALEADVRGPAVWQRLTAVEALTLRTEPRVPEILQWVAAADADRDVMQAAVDALARVGVREHGPQGREATRALIALTAEPARRSAAIAALSGLPARRIGDIAGGLRHPSPEVRVATVEALGRMKLPEASRVLETALDDATPSVRLAAVSELKRLGSRSAEKKLMAMARTDADAEVRRGAMRAIARLDGPTVFDS
jgi:HEAT repeat protein